MPPFISLVPYGLGLPGLEGFEMPLSLSSHSTRLHLPPSPFHILFGIPVARFVRCSGRRRLLTVLTAQHTVTHLGNSKHSLCLYHHSARKRKQTLSNGVPVAEAASTSIRLRNSTQKFTYDGVGYTVNKGPSPGDDSGSIIARWPRLLSQFLFRDGFITHHLRTTHLQTSSIIT